MTNEVDSTEIYKIMQPGQYVEVLKWVERSTRWRGHTSTGENPLLLPHTLCCVYCYVDLSCEGMWVSLVSQSGMQLLQFAKEVSTDEAVGGVAATEGLTKVAEAATEAPKVIPVNRVQYRCDKCSQVFDELAAAEKHEAACGTNPVDTNETMSDKLVDEEAANASSPWRRMDSAVAKLANKASSKASKVLGKAADRTDSAVAKLSSKATMMANKATSKATE